MEESSSEIQSPLTEIFPPVPSSILDSCPLILENDPSLEHLEKEETKDFGSEIEILPAKIPPGIFSPCALIEENCPPVISVTLEFSPLISQHCEELEPLDNEEQENPGPEIATCEEIRPTEEEKLPAKILPQEALPIGQVEESPDKPVPGFSKFLEILEEQYTVEDIRKTEVSSTFQETEGNKLGLVLDSKNQLQYSRKNITVAKPEGIAIQVEQISGIRPFIFSEICFPLEDIPDSLGPELPAILGESFEKKVTEENFTNSLIPVNVPALIP
ncbi:hypothetical protein PGTUg99_037328 [Puccinia graminis f. sp. tritici]|uniref:Uncharacterized protein n=1 Tax=Puccinia graminis f. sp. tritici TaxID=56615 RepID=A0A5B0PNY6_PUCGR|nr:hypothetical protein PGTUg99_037328 [Puccinia graminis f. sp. tritici]